MQSLLPKGEDIASPNPTMAHDQSNLSLRVDAPIKRDTNDIEISLLKNSYTPLYLLLNFLLSVQNLKDCSAQAIMTLLVKCQRVTTHLW